ncbi:hypothetical protein [Stappia sp.]|uniref:hypothetical protein n=1 Tax=Stappia sp. TaxID=1870903 RepID=UPI003A9A1EA5
MDTDERRAACDEIEQRLTRVIGMLSRHPELSSLSERLQEIRNLAALKLAAPQTALQEEASPFDRKPEDGKGE